MMELLQEAMELFGQLLDIGVDHPEVLVMSMIMAMCVVIAVAALLAAVVLSLPISIGYWIIHLCRWIYHLWYPVEDTQEDWDEDTTPSSRKKITTEKDDSLDPVYPEWMNRKGGRLL